ncbi:MAG: G1 family glutamic endopeptidase [bacterium]
MAACSVLAFGAFLFIQSFVPAAFAAPLAALNSAAGPGVSHNWAGYAATDGTYTAVRGSWIVPESRATEAVSGDSTWVGIGGAESTDLIQAGTEAITDSKGRMRYFAWYELLPETAKRISSLSVRPGDEISVSVGKQSGNDWLIRIENRTTGDTFEKNVSYESSLSSVEWIQERPTGKDRLVALNDFGDVTFSAAGAVADGEEATIEEAGAKPLSLIGERKESLAMPSALSASKSGFTVSRR